MRLKSQLPRLMDAVMIDNPYCNHVDFLWSLKVNEHVNDPIKETLRKTDDVNWKYSEPNPSKLKDVLDIAVDGNNSDGSIGGSGFVNISSGAANFDVNGIVDANANGNVNIGDGGHFNVSNSAGDDVGNSSNVNFGSGGVANISGGEVPFDLDYFAKNLRRIIADAMPKSMDRDDDAAVFESEQALQETLLADAIEFVRSVQKKYGPALDWQKSSTSPTHHRSAEQVVVSPNDAPAR